MSDLSRMSSRTVPSDDCSLRQYLAAASRAAPSKNHPAKPSLSTEMQNKLKQNKIVV